jgi:long-chain acyl-CoA synthetase
VQDVGALIDGALFAPKMLENNLKFSHYINEVVAFGNERERVCVFVDIDAEAVGNWADKQGLTYTGFADLAALDEVYGLIGEVIATVNVALAQDPHLAHTQIHRFLLLQKRLEPDDGELTRMRKVRRDVVSRRFASLVQAMYDGSPMGQVDAEVRYLDGNVGSISADIKIRDAKTFAAQTQQKAA